MIYGLISIISIGVIFFLLWFFLGTIKRKINAGELRIAKLFMQRNNLIPSIFEISQEHFVKHNEIFMEIIALRKIAFSQKDIQNDFNEIIKNQTLIHNELNFIFRIFHKHKKILGDVRYLYVKDLVIEKSFEISQAIFMYNTCIKIYNRLILMKKISLIGYMIPGRKKTII